MEECNLWSQIVHQLRASCSQFDPYWIRRRRVFNTETVVTCLMHLVGSDRISYSQALDLLPLAGQLRPSASSFCEARAKLPPYLIGEIRRDILEVWDDHSSKRVSHASWHGRRLYAVDGTRVSLPRALFADGFRAPYGGHYPQGLVSLLLRLDDRMTCDIRLSSHENERAEAIEHLAQLSHGDLVLYDRGYFSFSLLTAHVCQGVDAVFRLAKGKTFLAVEKFWASPRMEEIVNLDPTQDTYDSAKKQVPECELKPVPVRLIKYKIDGKTYMLATTVLDKAVPAKDLAAVYSRRWDTEEVFKSYKQTLGLNSFHGKSTAGVTQEVESIGLLWNLTLALGSLAATDIKKTYQLCRFIALSDQLPAVHSQGFTPPWRPAYCRQATLTCADSALDRLPRSNRSTDPARQALPEAIS